MRRYHPPERLRQVRDWPEVAWKCRYQVRALAQWCGVSVGQLRSFFEHEVNMPPKPWLRTLCMARAEMWLALGKSTGVVARGLFFTDAAHFCHEFKVWHGIGPARWDGPTRSYRQMPALAQVRLPVRPRVWRDEDFVWLF